MLQSALSPLSFETVDAFERLQSTPGELSPRFHLARRYEIVSRSKLDSLFAVCPGGWDRFAEAYPEAQGYITLSQVALDPSQGEALVYTEDHCGNFCGEGTYVYLKRVGSSWKVIRELAVWIS